MKTYIEYTDYNILFFENNWIPKDPNNKDYITFLEEQQKGEAELIPNTPSPQTWESIRAKRDELLKETDWMGATDADPKPNKESWMEYRKALRNIPQFFPSPQSVVWPIKPS